MHLARVGTWPVVGVLCGAWTAYFLAPEPPAALLAVPLVALGIAGIPRWPLRSIGLVAAASAITLAAGVSWGNVDLVLPFAFALFAAGRLVTGVWIGAALALVCIITSALREPGIGTLAVATALFGSMWVFGRAAHRSALNAHLAVQEARRLAAEDPAAVAFRKVLEERARLADQALHALHTAVTDMAASAHHARDLSGSGAAAQVHLQRIHDRGAAAVDQLRKLLGLLRAETEGTDPVVEIARPTWRGATAARAALAAATMAVLVLTHPGWERSPVLGALFGAGILSLLLVLHRPGVASLLLAAATLLVLYDPPADPESLFPAAVAYIVFAWSLGTRGSGNVDVALVAIPAVAALVVAAPHGQAAIAFIGIIFVLPFHAGQVWNERERILRRAERRGEVLRDRLDTVAATAVRNERLRLARELHDVTGHAVGVMVLQAGAAMALHDRDPEQAREAISTIILAGEDALVEIGELFGVLDASEFGIPRGLGDPDGLAQAIEDLASGVRGSGRDVTVRLGALPATPALAGTTYRIVQEALTNALRHSTGGVIVINVDLDGGDHCVRVTDGGTPAKAPTSPAGGGLGLTGLAERVRLIGGTCEVGPTDAGFVVAARLPSRAASVAERTGTMVTEVPRPGRPGVDNPTSGVAP
ncbi:histidine kinase [Nocardioides sp. AE5]|uniref:histidine kinase n=1 Tax=Nocardioides sp. AE5 TaxID=2962573 RepID=UPI002880E13C|nr:histidine kinase [Nocardioides sp. AE5]MDT0203841.1 histidine kinase [Nocardioides sp. AE5]